MVDSAIVSALEANKENRIEWALKTLYEARRTIGKKSAKLAYFMAKQHLLFVRKTKSAEYRAKNRDSARMLLDEAIAAGNKHLTYIPKTKSGHQHLKGDKKKNFLNPTLLSKINLNPIILE